MRTLIYNVAVTYDDRIFPEEDVRRVVDYVWRENVLPNVPPSATVELVGRES